MSSLLFVVVVQSESGRVRKITILYNQNKINHDIISRHGNEVSTTSLTTTRTQEETYLGLSVPRLVTILKRAWVDF